MLEHYVARYPANFSDPIFALFFSTTQLDEKL